MGGQEQDRVVRQGGGGMQGSREERSRSLGSRGSRERARRSRSRERTEDGGAVGQLGRRGALLRGLWGGSPAGSYQEEAGLGGHDSRGVTLQEKGLYMQ